MCEREIHIIIAVNERNKQEWAKLCVALWPEHCAQEFLDKRQMGHNPHEFLYEREGEFIGLISLSLRQDYVEGTSTSPVGYLEGIYVVLQWRGTGRAK